MSSYNLAAQGHFAISHSSAPAALLHDLSERPTPADIEALVASGDLFVELATELDDVTLTLIQTPAVDVSSRLDKLTEILLHLQRHYKISRKTSDYKQ